LSERAAPGSLAVLLRDHDASPRQRLDVGNQLRLITRRTGQQLWVADRLDLALLLEADGAHLGESSVSAHEARRLLGSTLHVSRAWHRADISGREHELDGVDALLLSPIFGPRKGRSPLGAPALAALHAALNAAGKAARLYALGGVTAVEVPACQAAGAVGIAAIGAALDPDPMPLLEALGIAAPQ
jgi:thiamine-phosphate pyrophosphorylase